MRTDVYDASMARRQDTGIIINLELECQFALIIVLQIFPEIVLHTKISFWNHVNDFLI